MDSKFKTPILFLIYNRPELTKRVFEQIRKIKPSQLFIAADGPKKENPGQIERCAQTRAIVENIDWDCDVKKLFRVDNAGCGPGVCQAITWFFEHVEEGIILEDDCLPSPCFFTFCSELLEHYRFDTRVMEVGGNNFLPRSINNGASYTFSNHNQIWGWATWRRAWQLFDFNMTAYEPMKKSGQIQNLFKSYQEREWFMGVFERSYRDHNITWDYQWEFARRINSGLSIVPAKNLVVNIGLGVDATHTFDPLGPGSNLKAETISFPLTHPEYIMVDESRDREFFFRNFTNIRSRLKSNIRHLLDPILRVRSPQF